jgi:hypothetical protein
MSCRACGREHVGPGSVIRAEKVPGWYTARRLAERVYGFKVLVEEDTGRILGAHLVGPHADEVINLFGLATRHDLTAKDLKGTMFAYPTGASDIGYMVEVDGARRDSCAGRTPRRGRDRQSRPNVGNVAVAVGTGFVRWTGTL